MPRHKMPVPTGSAASLADFLSDIESGHFDKSLPELTATVLKRKAEVAARSHESAEWIDAFQWGLKLRTEAARLVQIFMLTDEMGKSMQVETPEIACRIIDEYGDKPLPKQVRPKYTSKPKSQPEVPALPKRAKKIVPDSPATSATPTRRKKRNQ